MPIAVSDLSPLLLPGLRAEFARAYRTELDQSPITRIATVVETTNPSQRYGWLGSAPGMREFADERRPSGLAVYQQTIEDRVFESTLSVERRAMEDDQLGLIRLRVRDLATRVATHRAQLVIETLTSGFTAVGYDGVSLFSTNHPVGSASYTNRTGDALSAASLATAIETMMLVPDDQGVPLGITPDTLVVGPRLQWEAMELLESQVFPYRGNASDTAGANDFRNVLYGRLNLVVTPFLAGSTDTHWFVLDTKRAVRSVILQQRSDVPVEFTALDNSSGSEAAFLRDRFYFGVRARYNAGPGLWQTAYGSSA